TIRCNLSQGSPPLPPILSPNCTASGQFPLPNVVPANAVTDKMLMPTVDAWNLTIQHAFTTNMSFELGYVGNKGTHVFTVNRGGYDLNEPTIANYAKFKCYANDNSIPCLSRHPFFDRFGWTQPILYYGDNSSDNYHSLQAKV